MPRLCDRIPSERICAVTADIRAMCWHREQAEAIMRRRRDPRPVTTEHVLARIILAGLPKASAAEIRERRLELETWGYPNRGEAA